MRVQGKVVKFIIEKGIGFVRPDDSTLADTFIHKKHIEPDIVGFKKLAFGDVIEFDYVVEDRGPIAKNIKIINTVFVGEQFDSRGNRWKF